MFKKIFTVALVIPAFATSIDDIKKSMVQNYAEQMQNTKIIQKENEEIIKQNSVYYQNIINKAREYYSGYVSKIWGEENIKLSDIKSFTQYSNDMNSREHIDFERGEVTLEVVVDINDTVQVKTFEQNLENLKEQNLQQSLQKDPVAKLSKEFLEKKNIVSKVKTETETENFVKNLIDKSKIKQEELQEKIVKLKDGKQKKIVSVTIKMVPQHLEKRAIRYKEDVQKEAKIFNIKPSYIFGTMQTESYFNPLAISHVPAYGLMQIVPSTAGVDAYQALTGKKRLLPPPYLYDPQNNIQLGSQYVQIIKERYLRGIEDEESLFYCTATAYNAGIGTLIKSFTGSYSKREEAIKKINSMTPQEVYQHLHTSPKLNKEARDYVRKIKENSANYFKWDS